MIVEIDKKPVTRKIDTAAERGEGLRKTVLWICLAAVLVAWLPRMHWGLWTDEAGTFWMACQGWRAAISRSTLFPGQSILYSMLESLFVVRGYWQEPLLRVPSLIAMAIAAWQLKRISELLIAPHAGWLAVVPFICAPDVTNFATSARPYALALAASLATFRYLFEWRAAQDSGPATRYEITAKYLLSAVATLYLHYLFGFVFVIQAAYLLLCKLRGRKVHLDLPLAAAIVLPASLLPVIQSLRTLSKSAQFFQATPPAFLQIFQLCFPPALLLAAVLGAVLLLVSGRNAKWRCIPVPVEIWFLLGTWLLVAPVLFFTASVLANQTLFSARYLLFTLPAFVLLLTWLLAGLERKQSQLFVLVGVLGGAILHPGILLQNFQASPASWREPLEFVAAASRNQPGPVFIESGLANSSAIDWQTADPTTSLFYSALTAYPVNTQTIPLPYEFGDSVKDFVSARPLENGTRYLVAAADSDLVTWMTGYMKDRGFTAEVHPINDYAVVQFHR